MALEYMWVSVFRCWSREADRIRGALGRLAFYLPFFWLFFLTADIRFLPVLLCFTSFFYDLFLFLIYSLLFYFAFAFSKNNICCNATRNDRQIGLVSYLLSFIYFTSMFSSYSIHTCPCSLVFIYLTYSFLLGYIRSGVYSLVFCFCFLVQIWTGVWRFISEESFMGCLSDWWVGWVGGFWVVGSCFLFSPLLFYLYLYLYLYLLRLYLSLFLFPLILYISCFFMASFSETERWGWEFGVGRWMGLACSLLCSRWRSVLFCSLLLRVFFLSGISCEVMVMGIGMEMGRRKSRRKCCWCWCRCW
jgi:hypothetical protein